MSNPSDAQVEAGLKAYHEVNPYPIDKRALRAALAAAQAGEPSKETYAILYDSRKAHAEGFTAGIEAAAQYAHKRNVLRLPITADGIRALQPASAAPRTDTQATCPSCGHTFRASLPASQSRKETP